MPKTSYLFGSYRPDEGVWNAESDGAIRIVECTNVHPQAGTGFGLAPLPQWETNISTTEEIRGIRGENFPDLASATNINRAIVGTLTKLYMADYNGNFSDRTRVTGDYTIDVNGEMVWKFTRFGNVTLATNGTDAIQRRVFGVDADYYKNNLITTPTTADPRARYITTYKNHLFIAFVDFTAGTTGAETFGGAYGPFLAQEYPYTVMWSQTGNERRFSDPQTTPEVIGADYKTFFDDLGNITGIQGCSEYIAIFREKGIIVMSGPPWNWDVVSANIGCNVPHSIVRANEDIYFWSNGGPCVLRGGKTIEEIGKNKINKYVTNIKRLFYDSSIFRKIDMYGANSISGNSIYWNLRNFSRFSTVTQQSNILSYDTESKEFGLINLRDSINFVPDNFTDIQGIGSIGIQSTPLIDEGDGVFVVLRKETPADTRVFRLSRTAELHTWEDNDTGTGSSYAMQARLKTGFVSPGKSWRPKGVRLQYMLSPYDSTTWNIPLNIPVLSVRVYPASRYTYTDRNLSDQENAASTYYYEKAVMSSVTPLDITTYSTTGATLENDWIPLPEVPFAEFYAFEFVILRHDSIYKITGFDIDFEVQGTYSGISSR